MTRAHGTYRLVFQCYLMSGASGRHQGTRLALHLILQIPWAPISGATGYSKHNEAENMLSETFLQILGHFDYFGRAVWRHFMVLLYIFICFNPGHHSLQLFGRWLQCLFSWESPAVFCGLKTIPALPSAWGWVVNDCIFIFGWTIPLLHLELML